MTAFLIPLNGLRKKKRLENDVPLISIEQIIKSIEKEIEKPIIMKQIVETPNQPNVLCDLFNNIYFEFD